MTTNKKKILITPEQFDMVPELIRNGASVAELAERFGTTKNSFQVMCSRRGISLRRPGGPKRFRQRLEAPLDLNADVLDKLKIKALELGTFPSTLARDLITTIVSDDLFAAVLDMEGV